MLTYDGPLTQQMQDWIKSTFERYPNVLEIKSLPPDFNEWTKKRLAEHTFYQESDYGGSCERKSILFSMIRKDSNDPVKGLFIFFYNHSERQCFIEDWPDLIVNEVPFKTVIV